MAAGADTHPEGLSRRFAVCAQMDRLDGVQLGALLERHRPRLVLADAPGRMNPADLLVCAHHEVDVWALAQPGRPVRAFALRRWAGLPWVRLGKRRRLRERAMIGHFDQHHPGRVGAVRKVIMVRTVLGLVIASARTVGDRDDGNRRRGPGGPC